MYVYRDTAGFRDYLDIQRTKGETIGFVPTMGALHKGHMSLLKSAIENHDFSVVSIFVNPTQFNDPGDLSKYPRPIEEDIKLLYDNECDVAFIPTADEIYPENKKTFESLNFKGLDERMEGKFRPGHFNGVAQVMHRLLSIVQPQHLYMGQKDFQQTAIVRHMIKQCDLPVELIICPTMRHEDGLAMSSRNRRIDPELRPRAPVIYKALQEVKSNINTKSVSEIRQIALSALDIPGFRPEYFEIADGNTLLPVDEAQNHDFIVTCCAVWVGEVRLIDNIIVRKKSTGLMPVN